MDSSHTSQKIFLASDVRSGSTFTAELLAYSLRNDNIDILSLTRENFNFLTPEIDLADVFSALESCTTNLSSNDYVSSKLMAKELSILHSLARDHSCLHDVIYSSDSFWVTLIRQDLVSQAVSLAFAKKSGLWHHYSDDEPIESTHDEASSVTLGDAYKALHMLSLSRAFLYQHHLYLSSIKVPSMIIHYEDIKSSPGKILDSMRTFMGFSELNLSNDQVANHTCIKKTQQNMKEALRTEFAKDFLTTYF